MIRRPPCLPRPSAAHLSFRLLRTLGQLPRRRDIGSDDAEASRSHHRRDSVAALREQRRLDESE